MKTRNPASFVFGDRITRLALGGAAVVLCAGSALAQPTWVVSNAGLYLEVNAFANDLSNDFTPQDPLGVGVVATNAANAFVAGFGGASYGNRVIAYANDKNSFVSPQSFVTSVGLAEVIVDGDGTMEVELRWRILVDEHCFAPDEFEATGDAMLRPFPGNLDTFIELDTAGVPVNTPLIIYYSWDASARGFADFEPPGSFAPPPDYSRADECLLAIDGADQIGGQLNFDIVQPVQSANFTLTNQAGQFNIVAGQKVQIDVSGIVEAGMFSQGKGVLLAEDASSAIFEGRIRLSTGTPPIPTPASAGGLQTLQAPAIMDFSVDIGGDAELSELPGPPTEAIEVFDPGDVYGFSAVALPPGGADGYRNDAGLFSFFDPFPTPMVPGSQAPICAGPLPPGLFEQFFDLDGHDAISFPLDQFVDPIAPLPGPLGVFPGAPCIFGAGHLMVSFEDDRGRAYNDCDIPNNSLSPRGLLHGDSVNRDELFGVDIVPLVPAPPLLLYPIADEREIHISMAPTPDLGVNDIDDDVDSIDIPRDPQLCDHLLFSVDHEAPFVDPTNGLLMEPGAIYLKEPGFPIRKVIDPQIHLGLAPEIDIADFEFVWLLDTINGTNVDSLALVFAVHLDNPATPGDESGGLNPRRLYASFLNGSSFELMTGLMPDVVDGVTAYFRSLAPSGTVCCLGDADGDKDVDFQDITAVLSGWGTNGPLGDANCDGIVNFADVTAVLSAFGTMCP